MLSGNELNAIGAGYLPGYLGVAFTHVAAGETRADLPLTQHLMAPNGYLHAGTVVTLADTCAGYGCVASLPDGAMGFTTIELKANFLATARDGTLQCVATARHLGKTTQLWDAVVTHKETGKTLALFRCTQILLYPNSAA